MRHSILRRPRRVALLTLLVPAFAAGCGGGVGEVVLLCTVVKVIAGAMVAVLVAQCVSWEVEKAKLDVENKRLELEGKKDGLYQRSVMTLTDDQVETIRAKGKLEVQFEDSVKRVITVEHQ